MSQVVVVGCRSVVGPTHRPGRVNAWVLIECPLSDECYVVCCFRHRVPFEVGASLRPRSPHTCNLGCPIRFVESGSEIFSENWREGRSVRRQLFGWGTLGWRESDLIRRSGSTPA